MPAILRDLRVTKVDFVDAGDNKGAHVVLFKRAEPETQEGATAEMDIVRIDKSKLTPEDLVQLEAIEKKAGIPDEPPAGGSTASGTEGGQEPAPTQKNASAAPVGETGGGNAGGAEDGLFKGLHPDVKKALDDQMARLSAQEERLKKQADAFEERELQEVAKRYALIGKTPEELVPLFKNLKAAGGDAYSQMITILDASVQAVEKSGLYSELGRSGTVGGSADAWSRIEKHADDIQKTAPNLTRAEAIDKACQQHPELVHEYEANR